MPTLTRIAVLVPAMTLAAVLPAPSQADDPPIPADAKLEKLFKEMAGRFRHRLIILIGEDKATCFVVLLQHFCQSWLINDRITIT